MKKVVQRMCAICNMKKDKKELIRIVCDKEKNVTVDKTGKLQGRGAYICYNPDCLQKAIKSKKLDRTFETDISEEILRSLSKLVTEVEHK